jgi:quinol monooxygenase YgiN
MRDEELVFYVKLYVKPEHVEEWKAAVKLIIQEMAQEEAFISCHLHQDAYEDNLFTLYERWSEARVDAFLKNQMNAISHCL